MLGWVKAGLDYHRAHSPHSCVFCGSELGEQRLSSLAEAVDQRFEELVEDIKRVTERVKMVQREYIQLREQVASPSDVAFDARPLYERDLNKYRSHYATAIRSLGEALAVLTEKAATPNRRLGEKRLLGHDAALEWELESKTLTESVNLALVQHNTGYDNFDVLRQSAAKKIKAHYLAMDRSLYDEQLSKVDQAKAAVEKFAKEKGALEREIDDLGRKVREHGPAAVAINRLLHRYLSRTDIELVATEESFSIHRNGKLLSGPLSEGEKTAIALCYFLIGLEAEGRKTKDLIVVVDDPISSLDSRALNYAFSMIKRALSEAGQLIVLTHNLQFMNEVKKWLKRRTRNDAEKPATAALLFIEATQNADGSRSSKLRTLPTFLRDYESEYHYFFNLLWQYSKDAAANEGHSYLLPNAIRKVMEIFFAFHLPGPEGVGDKMQQIARSAVTLGTSEVDALDRLAQVESHSDSLDDFIMMSPMTVEETDRAVGALIKLMAEIAPEHVKRMEKLCS